MRKSDLLMMSISSLLRRRLRTFLTILGVVIGCISILLMMSLSLAMNKNLNEQMQQMGDLTQIQISSYTERNAINNKTLKEFDKMQYVKYVVPIINPTEYTFCCGKYRTAGAYWNVYVMTAEQMAALGYEVNEGRSLLENESRSIILGAGSLRYFTKRGREIDYRQELTPIPFDMKADKISIEVVDYDEQTKKPKLEGENGKIKTPASFEVSVAGMISENSNEGEYIIIPPELYNELKAERIKYLKALGQYTDENKEQDRKISYQNVVIKVDYAEHVSSVVEALKNSGYDAYTNMEWINEMKNQSKSREIALGSIGIVSFIVAAIGIANTMMMSIYERTKEIGIMKVIGAKMKDIKEMFLMESLLIGLFGGVIGEGISFLISLILNASGEKIAQLMDMYGTAEVSLMTPQLLLGGVVFSTVVGLVSGYYPAKKAMNLSALSAIKTE